MHHLQHDVRRQQPVNKRSPGVCVGKAQRHAGEIVEASKHNHFFYDLANKQGTVQEAAGTRESVSRCRSRTSQTKRERKRCCLLLLRRGEKEWAPLGSAAVVVAVSAGWQ